MATWKITNYVAAPDTGAIVSISWSCENKSEGRGAIIQGITELSVDPTNPSFIPLTSVSMDKMVGFLKTALGDAAADHERMVDGAFVEPTRES